MGVIVCRCGAVKGWVQTGEMILNTPKRHPLKIRLNLLISCLLMPFGAFRLVRALRSILTVFPSYKVVPMAGLEPARDVIPADFKSAVFTISPHRRGKDYAASVAAISLASIAENLAVLKEALQLDCGCFRGIGCMDDVGHLVAAEIAANGAFGSHFGVGRAEQVADVGNDVFTSDGDGDHRLALHETGHVREERFVGDVGIVLFEQRISELNHLAATDAEAFVFETFENFAIDTACDAVGFEQDEGGFLSHGEIRGKGRAQCRPASHPSRLGMFCQKETQR